MSIISKKILVTSGLSEENYNWIKPEIYRDNREKLTIFSGLGTIFLTMMFFISFVSNVMSKNRYIYVVGIVVSFIIFLLVKSLKKNEKYIIPAVYLFIALLFLIGLIMSVVTTPGERTVTFIAFMLLAPIVFNDRPIRMITCIGISTIIFIIAALRVKTGSVLESDIVNVFIYSILSMVSSTYMTVMKCERHFIEKEIKRLSRTDVLTGLYNRNAFSEIASKYDEQDMPKELTVVYFDVNDLKGANDNLGHDAGDELIKAAASCIEQTFKDVGTCCRTGGDEFIVIAELGKDKLLELCKLFQERTEKWTGRKVKKLRVSYGYASKYEFPEASFSKLEKIADKRLYNSKREFYSTEGNDRRGQRGVFGKQ